MKKIIIIATMLIVALTSFTIVKKQNLSDEEKKAIIYLREEEKLARDVYTVLYDKWNLRVFENIKASEQRHIDAMLMLIETYDLQDPVKNDETGKFTNPEITAIYKELIDKGLSSETDALLVGATIEDMDIADLQKAIERTEDDMQKNIYGRLLQGSENHMRAFTRNLQSRGATYEPVYISTDEYARIISVSGNGRGMRGMGMDMQRGR